MSKIICKVCSSMLSPKREFKNTCSRSCNKKYLKELFKDAYKCRSVCSNCNTVFDSKQKSNTYCSSDCRMEHQFSKRKEIQSGTRFSIFERDKFCCIYCGKNPIDDKVKLHLDHIIPVSRGGLSDIDNLVTSCSICNLSKSNNMLSKDMFEKVSVTVTERNSKLSQSEIYDVISDSNKSKSREYNYPKGK